MTQVNTICHDKCESPAVARFVYPEFLPNPDFRLRHRLAERLERADMLRRRARIDIPEFYVGEWSRCRLVVATDSGELDR